VSLTVVKPLDDGFTVALIPHTAEVTTLGHKGPGATVNLEVDVMAKYAERLLDAYRSHPSHNPDNPEAH
jgi:riboflavin synthase